MYLEKPLFHFHFINHESWMTSSWIEPITLRSRNLCLIVCTACVTGTVISRLNTVRANQDSLAEFTETVLHIKPRNLH